MQNGEQKKVCVVTGGAGGIGRCIAETYAQEYDAAIAMIDLAEEEGFMTKKRLESLGAEVLFFCGDVGDKAVLEAFAGEIGRKFGRVDVLVNNACLSCGGLPDCSYDDFQYVLQVGVAAPYYLTKLCIPFFTAGASVINISSTRAFMSQAGTESYTAAKGGITALTHAMACSLAGRVRVNGVAPGWIDTGGWHGDQTYTPMYTKGDMAQHTVGRIGVPADIARAVLFFCDDKNSFINGQVLTVDGGMTKRMIYSGDEGWAYRPEPEEELCHGD